MKPKQLNTFLRRDLWRLRLRALPKRKAAFYRFLRIVMLTIFQFRNDKCALRASALTFFTLMSIVPVLAMSFGIAKGFGFEKVLERELRDAFQQSQPPAAVVPDGSATPPGGTTASDAPTSPSTEAAAMTGTDDQVRGSQVDRALDQAITFANSMLENTKGGLIAGIGLALLLWTVVKVLGNIEASFNDIWGIQKSRTLLRKFSDYLSFLFITPILLLLSQGLTVFVTSQVTAILHRLSFLGFLSTLILFFLQFLPYVILWILFTFTYMFMPNTKVRYQSALVAGIVAGTLFQLFQWVYISTQFGVTKANAIYGSFAALPLFLTWLQVGWMVVLFGAEFSYAHQNIDLYEWMEEAKSASPAYRRLLTLAIVHCCVRRFCQRLRPPTIDRLTSSLDAPPRLVRDCIDRLLAAHVLVEVLPAQPGGDIGYHPASDVESLRITDVFEKLDILGYSSLPLSQAPVVETLSTHLDQLKQGLQALPGNALIKDIPGDLTAEISDDERFPIPEGSERARVLPL